MHPEMHRSASRSRPAFRYDSARSIANFSCRRSDATPDSIASLRAVCTCAMAALESPAQFWTPAPHMWQFTRASAYCGCAGSISSPSRTSRRARGMSPVLTTALARAQPAFARTAASGTARDRAYACSRMRIALAVSPCMPIQPPDRDQHLDAVVLGIAALAIHDAFGPREQIARGEGCPQRRGIGDQERVQVVDRFGARQLPAREVALLGRVPGLLVGALAFGHRNASPGVWHAGPA